MRLLTATLFLCGFLALSDASQKPYVVFLNTRDTAMHLRRFRNELSAEYQDLTIEHVYDFGYFANLTDEQVAYIKSDHQVEAVVEDYEMHAYDLRNWGLARIQTRELPLPDMVHVSPESGTDVTVYIIDTGIEINHPDFEGKASFGIDFVDSNARVDKNGHGTHVAGIVSSARFGVNRNASLVAVRVLDHDGMGKMSTILRGIDWVSKDHNKRRRSDPKAKSVLNMSLGGQRSNAFNAYIERLVDSGIVVVVAAGNEHTDACLSSPASCSGCITVAATMPNDTRAPFSNFGSCVDLFAPGLNVTSTWLNHSSKTISGTSMAAPHVAGIAASLMSWYEPEGVDVKDLVLAFATRANVTDARSSPLMAFIPPTPMKRRHKPTPDDKSSQPTDEDAIQDQHPDKQVPWLFIASWCILALSATMLTVSAILFYRSRKPKTAEQEALLQ